VGKVLYTYLTTPRSQRSETNTDSVSVPTKIDKFRKFHDLGYDNNFRSQCFQYDCNSKLVILFKDVKYSITTISTVFGYYMLGVFGRK